MDRITIPVAEKFKYLGSFLQEKEDINEDINHRIKAGFQKWNNASGVLCDKRISIRLKRRVYYMAVI